MNTEHRWQRAITSTFDQLTLRVFFFFDLLTHSTQHESMAMLLIRRLGSVKLHIRDRFLLTKTLAVLLAINIVQIPKWTHFWCRLKRQNIRNNFWAPVNRKFSRSVRRIVASPKFVHARWHWLSPKTFWYRLVTPVQMSIRGVPQGSL